MAAGRHIALTAAGIIALLALMDVRPSAAAKSRPLLRPEHTDQAAQGSDGGRVVTRRDTRRASVGRDRPAPELLEVAAHSTTAGQRDGHDVLVVPRGDGHRFGYVSATAPDRSATSPSLTETVAASHPSGREAARPTAWTWRAGETTGGSAPARGASGTSSSLAVARAETPGLDTEAPSLRVTQTFAYVHGATTSASTSSSSGTGAPPGFEVDTETDTETDVDLGTDTGHAMEPTPRRAGGSRPAGQGHAGTHGHAPPGRAGTRGPVY